MIMTDFNAHVPINALDYIADDDLDSHINYQIMYTALIFPWQGIQWS